VTTIIPAASVTGAVLGGVTDVDDGCLFEMHNAAAYRLALLLCAVVGPRPVSVKQRADAVFIAEICSLYLVSADGSSRGELSTAGSCAEDPAWTA
jgi:hypothetical protein